jgi:RNA polymerase sigma-70 factor, ECF subfamily
VDFESTASTNSATPAWMEARQAKGPARAAHSICGLPGGRHKGRENSSDGATLFSLSASKIAAMGKFADIGIDDGIVRRAARGDVRAHEIIYRAFATPVYTLCLRFTKSPAHAEDLTQETFIEVMRSIARFRGDAALGSWIRRIAVSKALMFLRSAWTARSQAFGDNWDDVTPGDNLSHGISRHPDDAMDLDAALASLPDVARTVVWLHDVEGFTHKEIASAMGKTESFSKSQLSRAYQRLKPLLEPADAVPDAGCAALRSN